MKHKISTNIDVQGKIYKSEIYIELDKTEWISLSRYECTAHALLSLHLQLQLWVTERDAFALFEK